MSSFAAARRFEREDERQQIPNADSRLNFAHCGMKTTIEHAQLSRILGCVTFHFRAWRLAFLAETLRTLSEFQVTSLDVVIVTNSSSAAEIALLDRLAREIFPHKGAQIRTYEDLADPKDLAWCHKGIIADEFVAIN